MAKQVKSVVGERILDIANYRAMCEPFADLETANKAIGEFWKEVGDLRKKHRIRDVICVIGINVIDKGEEITPMTYAHFGSESAVEGMLAYAFGRAQVERALRIKEMMDTAKVAAADGSER